MSDSHPGTSKQRPYLLRAMHEWMTDNGLTPHIVIDASRDGLMIPMEHVKDGKLVLNVSYTATRELVLGNDLTTLEARFDGAARRLNIPVDAIMGIYARETGQGMIFSDESVPDGSPIRGATPGIKSDNTSDTQAPDGTGSSTGGKRPQLTIVK